MQDLDFDLYQYRLLRKVVEENPLTIDQLSYYVNGVRSILHAIKKIDHDWLMAIDASWWDLEIVFSLALDENRMEFNENEKAIIEHAHKNIKFLVKRKLLEVENDSSRISPL